MKKIFTHIAHLGGIREDDSKRNLSKSESDSDASESNRNLNSDKEILPDRSNLQTYPSANRVLALVV